MKIEMLSRWAMSIAHAVAGSRYQGARLLSIGLARPVLSLVLHYLLLLALLVCPLAIATQGAGWNRSGHTVYMHYGNLSSSSMSDGEATCAISENFDVDNGEWTEYDPNNKIELDYTTDHRLEFNHWIRPEPGYVSRPYSTQDFVLDFDIRITASGGNAKVIGPGFSDTLDTIDQIQNGVHVVYYAGFPTVSPRLSINTRVDGTTEWGAGGNPPQPNRINISKNVTYYVRLEKSGSTITLSVFSDQGRTAHIAGSPKTVTTSLSGTTFNYFYAVNGYTTSPIGNWEWTTGWIDNIKVCGGTEQDLPDLELSPSDISFSPAIPEQEGNVTISATVHNTGNVDANNVTVQFFDGDPDTGGIQIGSDQIIDSIAAGGEETAEITWDNPCGTNIYVVVDPDNSILESREDNNKAYRKLSTSGLCWPLAPRNKFHQLYLTYGDYDGGVLHEAIDILPDRPDEGYIKVYAIEDGEVENFKDCRQIGNEYDCRNEGVIIRGSNRLIRYWHVKRRDDLNKGDPVKAGELLGILGKCGDHPKHLHFAIIDGSADCKDDKDDTETLPCRQGVEHPLSVLNPGPPDQGKPPHIAVPEIEGKKLPSIMFRRNEQDSWYRTVNGRVKRKYLPDDSEEFLDPKCLHGEIDILVHAYDYIEEEQGPKTGVNKICYEISVKDSGEVKESECLFEWEGRLPISSALVCPSELHAIYEQPYACFYADDAEIPVAAKYPWTILVPKRTWYIVTNKTENGSIDRHASWDTTKLSNGDYTVKVTAWNWQKESNFAEIPVHVNNLFGGFFCGFDLFNGLAIYVLGSVDLEVTDPDGLRITGQLSQIPGATYEEIDLDQNGRLDGAVLIPNRKVGTYLIRVAPKPDAKPSDTYTLGALANDKTLTLADDVPVSNIPEEGYTIVSSDQGIDQPPKADAGPDQTVNKGDEVTLDGSGSHDPDSDPLTYSWSFISKPCDSSATLSDPNAVNPTFIADKEGTYKLQLEVDDGRGGTDTDEVEINAGGLVGYWKFDEGSGTTADDCSGTGNNGTIDGATYKLGVSGTASEFDGVDDFILASHDPSLSPNTLTIEAWIKLDDLSTDRMILGKYNGDYREYWLVVISTERLGLLIGGGSGNTQAQSPLASISPGRWYHVVGTYDGTNLRVYINGVERTDLIVIDGTPGPIAHNNNPLFFGKVSGGTTAKMKGVLDEIRIYNRALSGKEVHDHYREMIMSASPILCVTPDHLDFTMEEGTNPPSQTLEISNCGVGTLKWSITDDAKWLSVRPSRGRNDKSVKVRVHAAMLGAGTYTGKITVTATGARESPQEIAVTLIINTGAPRAPRALRARARSATRIDLRWRGSSWNEEGFRIYRNGTSVATLPANSRRYSDTGLAGSTRYCYQVAAYNAAGESYSNERCATTRGTSGLSVLGVSSAAPSKWDIATVDPAGDVGEYTSLALDNSGNPRISYFDVDNYNLKYAWKDGDDWHTETVDFTGDVGEFTSLALDASGNPHISYYDYSNGNLKYAWKDGGRWHIEIADSEGDVGESTSLALDASGNPHISYFDVDNYNLKYAWKDGDGWHTETVDFTGDVGEFTSLALDNSGNPHISYYDAGNGDLKYAWKDGGGWQTTKVDSAGDVGWDTSIALNDSGYPCISYYDAGNYNLKYAWKDGTDWHIELADSAGDVGESTSLALDASGNPHISYFDASNYNLKYAWKDEHGWHTTTGDSAGDVGEYTSLVLDNSANPHISYYDAGNGDLKYAVGIPGGTPAVFRVTREGDVYADRAYYCGQSSYGACFQAGQGADIAEYINVSEPVEPGDVVELDPEHPGHYRKSRGPYSTLAAGVISTRPGITMGQLAGSSATTSLSIPRTALNNLDLASAISVERSLMSLSASPDNPLPLTFEISLSQLLNYLPSGIGVENKPLLALMGVVPVKATTENGPIKLGDLLTTSSTPGYAMRCNDPQECEGAIIGKALEPLESGIGSIRMLVMR